MADGQEKEKDAAGHWTYTETTLPRKLHLEMLDNDPHKDPGGGPIPIQWQFKQGGDLTFQGWVVSLSEIFQNVLLRSVFSPVLSYPPYSDCRVATNGRMPEFAFGEPPFAHGAELLRLNGTYSTADLFLRAKGLGTLAGQPSFWDPEKEGGASAEEQEWVADDDREGGFNLWLSCTIAGDLPNSKTSPQTALGTHPLRFAPNCSQCAGCTQKKACINQQAGDKVNCKHDWIIIDKARISSLSPLCPKAGANCTALISKHFKFNLSTGEIRYNPPGLVFWRGNEAVYNAENE
jgi:hypothetical protein